jgi:hypothetical protein
MRKLICGLLLLLPALANADWLTFHSTPMYAYTIKKVQFTQASGSNNGVILFWVNEYEADGNPNTRFTYEFSPSGGMSFEQAKMFHSMLMTAYTTGQKILIGIPGTGVSPVQNVANAFDTIRLVE